MANSKVLIIGLDGATFNIINPLVEQGRLPNIGKLIRSGCHGNLLSTTPCLSPVAWTSFFTGCNPGKHGIFDFFRKAKGTYSLKINNFSHCRVKGVWDYLNSAGRKTAIINIPNTYPPPPVDGFFIAGMGTPSEEAEFCNPHDLKKELKEKVGGFEILMRLIHDDRRMEEYLVARDRLIDNQTKAVKYLLENKEWDLFIHVFTITDTVQHDCWKYGEKSHPLYSSQYAQYHDVINETYEKVDRSIGEFLELIDDDTTVILVSDHGQGPLNKTLSLNNWLQQAGFLTFKENHAPRRSKGDARLVGGIIFRLIKICSAILTKVLPRKYRDKVFKIHRDRFINGIFKKSQLFLNGIRWEKTKAYCEGTFSFIFVNKEGFYPGGIVKDDEIAPLIADLKKQIMAIKDDQTGETIAQNVFSPEEIYKGRYISDAPDLIIALKEGYHSSGSIERSVFDLEGDELFTPHKWSGFHTPNGIFVINGKNIKKNSQINNAGLPDITPTVLHLMNVAIPEEMDGKVLAECFSEEFVASRQSRYSDETVYKKSTGTAEDSSDEDEDEMRKQLSDLGYL